MNLVITNRANEPVPVMSSDEGGWHANVEPGTPLTINRPDSDVIIIGDKPDVSEQIEEGLGIVKKVADKVRATLTAKPKPTPTTGQGATLPADQEMVTVIIGNNGENFVRVILGDGVTSNDVAPGVSFEANAPRYVEVRELGNAPQQGGTPD